MNSDVKLSDLLEIKYGKDHKNLADGIIPVYGSGGIMRYVNEFLYDGESILIPRKGTLNNLFYVRGRFWTVDTIFWSKINTEKVFGKFLFYYLTTLDFASMNVGTAVPSMTSAILNDINIKLPSIDNQKKIAHILSTLDDKIELNRKMNQTLEEMASAIFKSWFVDFDPVHAKANCTDEAEFENIAKELGISKEILDLFPSEFEESELGIIPKGWEIKQFSSLVKHLKPGTNYQPDRVEDGIPFVNGKHIQDGFLDLTDIKYITQDEYDRVHKSWQPEAYDVLITIIGTLGKVGVIMPSDLPLALHYNSIDIKAGKLNHQFLYFLLKSDFFQKQFHTNKKQAVQEFITIEAVEQLKILMLNSEKIFEILSGIFDSYFNLIEINTNHIRTLEKTRDTLLPKLLSGEIDVSELEIK